MDLAVNAGLADPQRRSLLLAWLPQAIQSNLPTLPAPADQLRSDVVTLNGIPLPDGRPAVVVWIENAERLVSYLPGVPDQLRQLREAAARPPAQPHVPPTVTPIATKTTSAAPETAPPALRLVIAADACTLTQDGAEIWRRAGPIPTTLTLGRTTVPIAEIRQRVVGWDRAQLITLGDALQAALFGGEAPGAVLDAIETAIDADRRLVLDLHRSAAVLPWEYLRAGDDFVGEDLVLVRHQRARGERKPLVWSDPLGEIAFASANLPRARHPFNEGLHASEIQAGLERYRDTFTSYPACTVRTLRESAIRRGLQALHFLGHGTTNGLKLVAVHRSDAPTAEAPSADTLTPVALAGSLREVRDSLRYVFLGACYSAAVQTSEDDLSGIAQTIVKRTGAPVIAMQTAVPQAFSTAFARGFYRAIATQKDHDEPVDLVAAFDSARNHAASPRWFGIPVLYADFRA